MKKEEKKEYEAVAKYIQERKKLHSILLFADGAAIVIGLYLIFYNPHFTSSIFVYNNANFIQILQYILWLSAVLSSIAFIICAPIRELFGFKRQKIILITIFVSIALMCVLELAFANNHNPAFEAILFYGGGMLVALIFAYIRSPKVKDFYDGDDTEKPAGHISWGMFSGYILISGLAGLGLFVIIITLITEHRIANTSIYITLGSIIGSVFCYKFQRLSK